jgi:hypothetical protein
VKVKYVGALEEIGKKVMVKMERKGIDLSWLIKERMRMD